MDDKEDGADKIDYTSPPEKQDEGSGDPKGTAAPTWDTIKTYFTPGEITCMQGQGIDLSDCNDVLGNAKDIYNAVKSGKMPLGGPRWSDEWVANFYAWWQSNPTCPS